MTTTPSQESWSRRRFACQMVSGAQIVEGLLGLIQPDLIGRDR